MIDDFWNECCFVCCLLKRVYVIFIEYYMTITFDLFLFFTPPPFPPTAFPLGRRQPFAIPQPSLQCPPRWLRRGRGRIGLRRGFLKEIKQLHRPILISRKGGKLYYHSFSPLTCLNLIVWIKQIYNFPTFQEKDTREKKAVLVDKSGLFFESLLPGLKWEIGREMISVQFLLI